MMLQFTKIDLFNNEFTEKILIKTDNLLCV